MGGHAGRFVHHELECRSGKPDQGLEVECLLRVATQDLPGSLPGLVGFPEVPMVELIESPAQGAVALGRSVRVLRAIVRKRPGAWLRGGPPGMGHAAGNKGAGGEPQVAIVARAINHGVLPSEAFHTYYGIVGCA